MITKKNQARLLWLFALLTAILIVVLLINPSILRLAGAALNMTAITCDDISEIPGSECQTIDTLFKTTNGINWGNRTGWFVTTTPCSWYGIRCTAGHVTSLVLDNNQLSGNLTDLSGLSELENLSFSRNQLSGSLPIGLGELSKLKELNLSYNQFSGPVPVSLEKLRNLRKLHLQANFLGGDIPDQLGSLPELEELFLHYNQFNNGIPATLGNLSLLKVLRISHNQLVDDIPANLGNLGQLVELDLSTNQLTGSIPEQFGNMINLKKLYLNNNLLEGEIPASFASLDALVELNMMNNRLNGNIPPALGGMEKLVYLNISGNQLTGLLPVELSNNADLQQLILKSNLFTGGIPAEIGKIVGLKTLDVSHNAFEGEIPSSLALILESGPDIWNYVSFGYNRLEADDPILITYLEMNDPYWQNTQTIPPVNLTAKQVNLSTLELSWIPIPYTENGGYYEVSYATTINGPYAIAGHTSDKTIGNYWFTGLAVGAQYYFRVRTFTPAHDTQANDLWSAYTPPTPITMASEIPPAINLFLPFVRR